MKTLPIVEVFWIDAQTDCDGGDTWEPITDSIKHGCVLIHSVGQLLSKTDNVITLAVCHCENETICRFRIPTNFVQKYNVIRPAGEEEINTVLEP